MNQYVYQSKSIATSPPQPIKVCTYQCLESTREQIVVLYVTGKLLLIDIPHLTHVITEDDDKNQSDQCMNVRQQYLDSNATSVCLFR